jgi:hypothetical protein
MNTENNKLIAEFMGYRQANCNNGKAWNTDDRYLHKTLPIQGRLITKECEYLKFNSSWDWLMPVIEKIEKMGYDSLISNFQAHITKSSRTYSNIFIGNAQNAELTKLKATYKMVVEFIKWYNKQKETFICKLCKKELPVDMYYAPSGVCEICHQNSE